MMNKELQLVNGVVFTGKDQFTKQDIRIEKSVQDTKYLSREDGSPVNLNVTNQ